MNANSMKEMFERLDNGGRLANGIHEAVRNSAVDKRILAEQPETATWDNDRDSYLDYMSYAGERTFGKAHEEAIAHVEKMRKHR